MTKSSIAIGKPLVKSLIFAVTTTLVLAFVAIELGGFTFYDKSGYGAVFADASDLQPGDDVLVAGVKVGTVDEITVNDQNRGEVRFQIKDTVSLDDKARAAVRYKNLTGDRYLELVPGGGSGALSKGTTIPVDRTSPALDLDLLLGGLKPLFQGLDPKQINQLSGELVAVLQGEGGTIETLLRRIGSFSSGLANEDEVIGQVITNMNTVLGNLDTHSVELSDTVSTLQQLASGLALDRGRLGRSFANVDKLVTSMNGLLVQVRDPFQEMVRQVGRVSRQANAGSGTLNEFLRMLPGAYLRIGRLASRGSGYNLYLCSLRLRVTDPLGNAYYTPWVGPADSIKRCKPGVAPLQTPEEREAADAASREGKQ
ncbi:MCE family protein [Nocardioides sp. GCM10030258]|uniref:MCE family protein n=1 Tax=unclassified Nocardioides TaxID=2615069 RepID=UPI003607AA08